LSLVKKGGAKTLNKILQMFEVFKVCYQS
jgi:hypothetical protein